MNNEEIKMMCPKCEDYFSIQGIVDIIVEEARKSEQEHLLKEIKPKLENWRSELNPDKIFSFNQIQFILDCIENKIGADGKTDNTIPKSSTTTFAEILNEGVTPKQRKETLKNLKEYRATQTKVKEQLDSGMFYSCKDCSMQHKKESEE